MKSLDRKRASHESFILGYVNKSISSSTLPAILKLAGITPVYKKHSRHKEKGSIENTGYPGGLPNWCTYLGTPEKQIYQRY